MWKVGPPTFTIGWEENPHILPIMNEHWCADEEAELNGDVCLDVLAGESVGMSGDVCSDLLFGNDLLRPDTCRWMDAGCLGCVD